MPRLRQVPRAEADPLASMMYQMLFGDRDPVAEPGTASGSPGDWWTVFALVPDALQHAVGGFTFYRSPDRRLDPVLRELGQARTGWARGSTFVFSQHCKACRDVGLSDEQVAALPHWSVAECFDPAQRAVLAYTDCLVLQGGRTPDGIIEALRAHLSDEEVLELTYIVTTYDMHAVTSKALRLEFDDVEDPCREQPDLEGRFAGLALMDDERPGGPPRDDT
ncbi:MAG: carboxymuconolactone decarboxylase family protein [Actinomycetota bacterium]|nr:carboxymuconolactone decarboxylase family protein [Actinomycetota bacterium]